MAKPQNISELIQYLETHPKVEFHNGHGDVEQKEFFEFDVEGDTIWWSNGSKLPLYNACGSRPDGRWVFTDNSFCFDMGPDIGRLMYYYKD